jgi:hypothetical protein
MKRSQTSLLLMVAAMAAFWAYAIVDTLIREFAKDVSNIDLGAIFVLGIIAGAALGVAAIPGCKRSDAR